MQAQPIARKRASESATHAVRGQRSPLGPEAYARIRQLALRVARRLPRSVDVDDLISAGAIGYLDAAARYDATVGERFEAYAEHRVRGAMLDELRSRDPLSRDARRRANQIREATRRLEGALGRAPEQAELAEAAGLAIAELDEVAQRVAAVPFSEAELPAERSLDELVACTRPSAEASLLEGEARQRVLRAIAALPERARLVLSLYYVENLQLKEVGQVLGVTESRVCQIHGDAIRRIRALLDAEDAAA